MRTRVLIVEDHPKTLASMVGAVEAAEDMVLVAAVPTLAEGLALLADADLELVDLHLGEDSGLDLIAAAQGVVGLSTLVVTMFGDERTTVTAIEAGADGYVLKGDPNIDLIQSVRNVLAGEAPISPAIARHLLRRLQTPAPEPLPTLGADILTKRERQVLEALAAGASYKEVAREFGLSPHTVNFHVRSLYKKLSARSRGEAVKNALQQGVITIERDA